MNESSFWVNELQRPIILKQTDLSNLILIIAEPPYAYFSCHMTQQDGWLEFRKEVAEILIKMFLNSFSFSEDLSFFLCNLLILRCE